MPKNAAAIVVRVANEGDLEALAALRRVWSEENAGSPIDDEEFAVAFIEWWHAEGASRAFFVVEVQGTPIGMANVKEYARMPTPGRRGGSWGYVGNVFVRADHRNRGVGDALMKELIAWSFERGYDHLRLAPSERSVPFYDRLGFVGGSVVQLDP